MCEYSWYNHSLRKCSLCSFLAVSLDLSPTNEVVFEVIFLFRVFYKSEVLELNLKDEYGSPLGFWIVRAPRVGTLEIQLSWH